MPSGAEFGLAIVGAGPAGTGPLLSAAKLGKLDSFLDPGIALIEKTTCLGGTIGNYDLTANSLGTSFVECLEGPFSPKLFPGVIQDESTRDLFENRLHTPRLPLVGHYISLLGDALRGLLEKHPRSRVFTNTAATAIYLGDETVTVKCADREIRARHVLLAMGGESMRCAALDNWRDKTISSDDVLIAGGLQKTLQLLPGDAQIAIVGGSHSGFCVANALLYRLPTTDVRVTIICRREPRIFYATRGEADADAYPYAEADVCPFTQRVNRLGGLRFEEKELWRKLNGRAPADGRVEMRVARLDDCANLLDNADLIISAVGYRMRTLPIFDRNSNPVRLARNLPLVDERCRLLLADGTPAKRLFGSGLGSGYRPAGMLGGEPSFDGQQNSLWLYQHGIGAIICNACELSDLETL
jgi:hypothetical protein